MFSFFKKKDPSAAERYIQGLNLFLEGRTTEALSAFIESVTLDSDNAIAYFHVGNILRQGGNLARAEKIHSELLKRYNLPADLRLKLKTSLTRLALQQNNRARAEDLLREIAAEAKADWVKEELLALYELSGKWQEAIDLKLELDKSSSKSDSAKLAYYYFENGLSLMKESGRNGRIQFKEAIKLNPRMPWPYILIADSYFAENRADDALAFWSKLFDTVPAKAYLVFDKIEKYYYTTGDYDEVGRIYRRMVVAEPENLNALLALSRYLFRKGELEDALVFCRQALSVKPDSREAFAELLRQSLDSARSLDEIRGPVEDLLKLFPARKTYHCAVCRARAEEAHWRCRQCGSWDPYGLA
ncbi:MAG: hypothetical protein A2293_08900 [Elusimicrobia bacterium RIFOXYB2_FULL_49_7]|nr:MAG: hypothetical protein A2293_08900 [Elusimicrobia bacterium RIFOXYB2_FULL_49_7]